MYADHTKEGGASFFRAAYTLILHTDASYQGIGAVLSVVREGVEQPLGYFSKCLLQAERNYAATEIECLAIVKAIDHFAIHLVGKKCTDHKALKALHTSQKLNGRMMRWAIALQAYDFEVLGPHPPTLLT